MRFVVLLLALGACGKKDSGPTCEQVVDHMLEVTKQNLPGHDDTSFNSQKKAMVAQCESRGMSSDVRTCLMGAQSIAEVAKCRGGKSDVLERPRRPRPGSGSMAHPGSAMPSGSADHPIGTGSAGSGSNSGSGSAK